MMESVTPAWHCIPHDDNKVNLVLFYWLSGVVKTNVWAFGVCLSLSGHLLVTVKFVAEV
jgi:hypothetical protein